MYFNETKGTEIKYEDIKSYYSLESLTKTSEEEGRRLFEQFCKTKNFLEMQPIAGAVEAVNQLSKKHKLLIITSRPEIIKKETYNSLEKYFNKSFSLISMLGNYSPKSIKTKKQICQENNCAVMIEDAYHHAIKCAEKGILTLLYNQPWNENKKLHKNIIRVNNWEEILEKINLLQQHSSQKEHLQ